MHVQDYILIDITAVTWKNKMGSKHSIGFYDAT